MRNKRAKSLKKLVQGEKQLYKLAKRVWMQTKFKGLRDCQEQ